MFMGADPPVEGTFALMNDREARRGRVHGDCVTPSA
jgi:hypothetical protein